MQSVRIPEEDGGIMGWARAVARRLHLPTTLVKFLIVGGIGFLINQFVLFLVYDASLIWFLPGRGTDADLGLFVHTDIRLLVASIVAVEVAIVSQFNFHERWTFRDRNRAGWLVKRFFKYNAGSIVSPIITVVTVNVLTPIIHDNTSNGTVIYALAPYLANTLGVLMGFTWNWTLNSLVIWPHHRDEAAA